ncbi:nuclear transport factor 2 family protein [Sphingobium phenoxybenzoativorans]|uniref:nuclear transport factor 2 family protein n=1 Tax=Sphingobium phenoxybenzoativorans TaxID=1592790 RepID=UPI0008733E50|nr:nuclear transport factor 2 family protein [Sphingobium phenoxybenzoativorans]
MERESALPVESALSDLLARREIRQLMFAYGGAADLGDPVSRASQLRAILAPDATIEYGFGRREGADAIIQTLNEILGGFEFTHHLVSNEEIEIDGDTARGHYLLTATHGPKDGAIFCAGARCSQRYARIDGRWVITSHLSQSLWNDRPQLS